MFFSMSIKSCELVSYITFGLHRWSQSSYSEGANIFENLTPTSPKKINIKLLFILNLKSLSINGKGFTPKLFFKFWVFKF